MESSSQCGFPLSEIGLPHLRVVSLNSGTGIDTRDMRGRTIRLDAQAKRGWLVEVQSRNYTMECILDERVIVHGKQQRACVELMDPSNTKVLSYQTVREIAAGNKAKSYIAAGARDLSAFGCLPCLI